MGGATGLLSKNGSLLYAVSRAAPSIQYSFELASVQPRVVAILNGLLNDEALALEEATAVLTGVETHDLRLGVIGEVRQTCSEQSSTQATALVGAGHHAPAQRGDARDSVHRVAAAGHDLVVFFHDQVRTGHPVQKGSEVGLLHWQKEVRRVAVEDCEASRPVGRLVGTYTHHITPPLHLRGSEARPNVWLGTLDGQASLPESGRKRHAKPHGFSDAACWFCVPAIC